MRPDISFLELRQKLPAQQRKQRQHYRHQQNDRAQRQPRPAQYPLEHPMVEGRNSRPDRIVNRSQSAREEIRRQHRRQRDGEQNRGAQRERVSVRHRREDGALDTAHREQRQERDHENQRREEHRAANFLRGGKDSKPITFVRALRRGQVPLDIFHHDDGGIDDDAEVDRAQRNKVGGRIGQVHQCERPAQRQRDVNRGDDCGAQVAEKENQHQENQHHPDREIFEHRVQRGFDQLSCGRSTARPCSPWAGCPRC